MTEHDPALPCSRVAADELQPGDPTPGMSRHVALHTETMWSGTVDTEAGAVSGWHHHGDHDTTLYIVSGRMRLESGPGGESVVEAGPATSCACRPAPSTASPTRATRRHAP